MTMHVTVISPERALFEGDADSVVAPAFDGLVGILPRHALLLTLLGTGTLTVRQGKTSSTFRVSGGFLQVMGDRVRAVADRAERS
jgi:F-type H+-transporting ATPase subunit epsilon